MMRHLVVLTGAGISAESGLKTFRDSDGLWEGHDIMEVATPEGFQANPELVLDFYNQRRRQLLTVEPNSAHFDLVKLEKHFDLTIITQNVDDLHERAGSTNVIHLHGELMKSRTVVDEFTLYDCNKDINLGDKCPNGYQLRPHVVWFGEAVPMIEKAMEICKSADLLLIIGTSMQVYPAAGLIDYVPQGTAIYIVDPKPSMKSSQNITVVALNATLGMKKVWEYLVGS